MSTTNKTVQEQIQAWTRDAVTEQENRRLTEIAALKMAGLASWAELREERDILRERILRGVRGGT